MHKRRLRSFGKGWGANRKFIFLTDEFTPNRLIRVANVQEFSNLFHGKRDMKKGRVLDIETPFMYGLNNSIPRDPINFPIISSSPKKIGEHCNELDEENLREQEAST